MIFLKLLEPKKEFKLENQREYLSLVFNILTKKPIKNMMMKCLFLAAFLIGILPSNSQVKVINKKKPIGKVFYVYRSKERRYLIEREAVLLFNNKSSVFIHSRGKEPFVEVMGDKGQDGYIQDKIGNLFYKDFEKDILLIRKLFYVYPYITEEPLPFFKWQITDENKKIGKFTCTKALTEFRGRKYEAWFTYDLPFSDGPWKFNGLPGLILEVVDSTGDYQFIFKRIEIPPLKIEPIKFIAKGEKVSFDVFIKAEDIVFEKVKKQTLAEWNGKGQLKVTKTKTNPIELNYKSDSKD